MPVFLIVTIPSTFPVSVLLLACASKVILTLKKHMSEESSIDRVAEGALPIRFRVCICFRAGGLPYREWEAKAQGEDGQGQAVLYHELLKYLNEVSVEDKEAAEHVVLQCVYNDSERQLSFMQFVSWNRLTGSDFTEFIASLLLKSVI